MDIALIAAVALSVVLTALACVLAVQLLRLRRLRPQGSAVWIEPELVDSIDRAATAWGEQRGNPAAGDIARGVMYDTAFIIRRDQPVAHDVPQHTSVTRDLLIEQLEE